MKRVSEGRYEIPLPRPIDLRGTHAEFRDLVPETVGMPVFARSAVVGPRSAAEAVRVSVRNVRTGRPADARFRLVFVRDDPRYPSLPDAPGPDGWP